MATRAGVSEYSTSPIAQRSSERSIRASWTTGYWGAAASIRASISTRFATTSATMRRASAPAAGSASTSARARSRTAVAVRWPKSASNTADSATRRPARSERTRSVTCSLGPDTVDQDRHQAHVEAEEPLHRQPDGVAHLPSRRDEVGSRPGDDPELDLHAFGPDPNDDRRSGEGGSPARAAPGDREHLRDLERRLAHHVDDHAPPDGQLDRRGRGGTLGLGVDDDRVEVGLCDEVAPRLEVGRHAGAPGSAATGSGAEI